VWSFIWPVYESRWYETRITWGEVATHGGSADRTGPNELKAAVFLKLVFSVDFNFSLSPSSWTSPFPSPRRVVTRCSAFKSRRDYETLFLSCFSVMMFSVVLNKGLSSEKHGVLWYDACLAIVLNKNEGPAHIILSLSHVHVRAHVELAISIFLFYDLSHLSKFQLGWAVFFHMCPDASVAWPKLVGWIVPRWVSGCFSFLSIKKRCQRSNDHSDKIGSVDCDFSFQFI